MSGSVSQGPKAPKQLTAPLPEKRKKQKLEGRTPPSLAKHGCPLSNALAGRGSKNIKGGK